MIPFELAPARKRSHQWEAGLMAAAARLDSQPFKWGSVDCVCVALRCIDAMTGSDHMSRVTWTDARTAIEALAQQPMRERMAQVAEQVIERVTFAQRGDLVLVEHQLPAVHVVLGRRALSASAATGCGTLAIRDLLPKGCTLWRLP